MQPLKISHTEAATLAIALSSCEPGLNSDLSKRLRSLVETPSFDISDCFNPNRQLEVYKTNASDSEGINYDVFGVAIQDHDNRSVIYLSKEGLQELVSQTVQLLYKDEAPPAGEPLQPLSKPLQNLLKHIQSAAEKATRETAIRNGTHLLQLIKSFPDAPNDNKLDFIVSHDHQSALSVIADSMKRANEDKWGKHAGILSIVWNAIDAGRINDLYTVLKVFFGDYDLSQNKEVA